MMKKIILLVLTVIAMVLAYLIINKNQPGMVELRINQPVLIENGMELVLIEASVPEEGVRDGMSVVVLRVTGAKNGEDLVFRAGGIAGLMMKSMTFGGVEFEIKEFSNDFAIVKYQ